MIPSSIDDLPDHMTEKITEWNYIFRGGVKGTYTIKAKTKEDAVKKIKKEWELTGNVPNLFVWSDDGVDKPSFPGYGLTTYGKIYRK